MHAQFRQRSSDSPVSRYVKYPDRKTNLWVCAHNSGSFWRIQFERERQQVRELLLQQHKQFALTQHPSAAQAPDMVDELIRAGLAPDAAAAQQMSLQTLWNLRHEQALSLAYFDVFWISAVGSARVSRVR